MVSPPNPELVVLITVTPGSVNAITLPIPVLQTIFQRALNTWSDVPEELLHYSDLIDKL